jgi:Zn-finger protein
MNCFYCFVLFYLCALMYIDMFGISSHRGSSVSEIKLKLKLPFMYEECHKI